MKNLFILCAVVVSLVSCTFDAHITSEQTDSTAVDSVVVNLADTLTADTTVVDTLAK